MIGLDLTDALFEEIGLPGLGRLGHHVDVRVFALIVEGGVPAEVAGRYVHCCCDLIAVEADEMSPCRRALSKPRRAASSCRREDVRPHIAGAVFQFFQRFSSDTLSPSLNSLWEPDAHAQERSPGYNHYAGGLLPCRQAGRSRLGSAAGGQLRHILRRGRLWAEVSQADSGNHHGTLGNWIRVVPVLLAALSAGDGKSAGAVL